MAFGIRMPVCLPSSVDAVSLEHGQANGSLEPLAFSSDTATDLAGDHAPNCKVTICYPVARSGLLSSRRRPAQFPAWISDIGYPQNASCGDVQHWTDVEINLADSRDCLRRADRFCQSHLIERVCVALSAATPDDG